jgi:hypothetical protein
MSMALDLEQRIYGADACTPFEYSEGTGPQVTPLPECWPGTSSQVVVVQSERGRSPKDLAMAEEMDMTDAEVGSVYWAWYTGRDRTGARASDDLIPLLEQLASEGSPRTFVNLVEMVDWSVRRPDELTAAIDLALREERPTLAMRLAQLGRELFPHHERIECAAQVLAPGSARSTHLPPAEGLRASRRWLREHADEYRGQWVAVRQGELVGVAPSLEEMETAVDLEEEGASVLVTRVL